MYSSWWQNARWHLRKIHSSGMKMNLHNLKKRLAFVFPASNRNGDVKDASVAMYVKDFDRVLDSMGCDENDLLAAIDKNWDAWTPSFKKK